AFPIESALAKRRIASRNRVIRSLAQVDFARPKCRSGRRCRGPNQGQVAVQCCWVSAKGSSITWSAPRLDIALCQANDMIRIRHARFALGRDTLRRQTKNDGTRRAATRDGVSVKRAMYQDIAGFSLGGAPQVLFRQIGRIGPN